MAACRRAHSGLCCATVGMEANAPATTEAAASSPPGPKTFRHLNAFITPLCPCRNFASRPSPGVGRLDYLIAARTWRTRRDRPVMYGFSPFGAVEAPPGGRNRALHGELGDGFRQGQAAGAEVQH